MNERDRERIPPPNDPNQPPPEPDPEDSEGRPHTGFDHEGNPVYGDRAVESGDEGRSEEAGG